MKNPHSNVSGALVENTMRRRRKSLEGVEGEIGKSLCIYKGSGRIVEVPGRKNFRIRDVYSYVKMCMAMGCFSW